jgi:hypothetical protein
MSNSYEVTGDPPFSSTLGTRIDKVELVADTYCGAGGAEGAEAAIR